MASDIPPGSSLADDAGRKEAPGRSWGKRSRAIALLIVAGALASARAMGAGDDLYRPQIHFSPARGWMNDPNGLVYSRGRYHLFYQYNPSSDSFGVMNWGHAQGADQIHWRREAIALTGRPERMIFSGSIVIDAAGSSGLCAPRIANQDCLVALYTVHQSAPGRPVNQTQNLAVSRDGGKIFQEFSGNPVLDEHSENFRDPKVQWHEASHRWVMLLARPLEHRIAIYGSPDLRHWTLLSEFGPAGATGGAWECPDLFSLPVDGDPRRWKWVLKVDLNPGHLAGGSGGQYFVGNFDGERFTADESPARSRWVDRGRDFYCATHWYSLPGALPDLTWTGWMNDWSYAGHTPTSGWRGSLSVPRRLGLVSTADGPLLTQLPVAALRTLRSARHHIEASNTAAFNAALARFDGTGGAVELRLELRAPRAGVAAGHVDLELLGARSPAATLSIDMGRRTARLQRHAEGNEHVDDVFAGAYTAALPDGVLVLQLIIDRSSVEIFSGDGTVVISALLFPVGGLHGLRVGNGSDVRQLRIDHWALRSALPR